METVLTLSLLMMVFLFVCVAIGYELAKMVPTGYLFAFYSLLFMGLVGFGSNPKVEQTSVWNACMLIFSVLAPISSAVTLCYRRVRYGKWR